MEEEKKRNAEKEAELQRRSELDRQNELKRLQKEEEIRKKQELDNKILQDAIERDRIIQEKEKAERERRKQDALNYRHNLKAQMSRDKEDDVILDQYRQQQLGNLFKV